MLDDILPMNVNSIISWLVILNLNGLVFYSECFLIALCFVYTTHYIWTYSNKTCATSRAGTAYPSGV